MRSAPAKAMLVLSGSPPPRTIACVSEMVPPSARICDHAMPATAASIVTGWPGAPAARSVPPGCTVTVFATAIRTTAHGSIVTVAAMLMSNGRMCGLAAAVHVSSAVMLPCIVPAPVGAAHEGGASGVGAASGRCATLSSEHAARTRRSVAAEGVVTCEEWYAPGARRPMRAGQVVVTVSFCTPGEISREDVPGASVLIEHGPFPTDHRMSTIAEGSELELLVLRAASGDDVAWHQLWTLIEPELTRTIANPRFLGKLGQREDDRKNIILETVGRLAANDRRRLRDYIDTRAANPRLGFLTWLRVVAKRVGIDYQRGHAQYIDRRREPGASTPGKWIEPGTLPSELGGERPPVTDLGTAHQVVAYATIALAEDQRRALELWVHGEPYDAIARQLDLASAADAERKVRAAIERLRRKFRGDDHDE